MAIYLQITVEHRQRLNVKGQVKTWPAGWVGSIDDDIAAAYIIAADKGKPVGPLAPEAAEIVELMRQVIDNLTTDNINPSFEAVVQSIAVMHEANQAAGTSGSLPVADDSPAGVPAARDGAPSSGDGAPSDPPPAAAPKVTRKTKAAG